MNNRKEIYGLFIVSPIKFADKEYFIPKKIFEENKIKYNIMKSMLNKYCPWCNNKIKIPLIPPRIGKVWCIDCRNPSWINRILIGPLLFWIILILIYLLFNNAIDDIINKISLIIGKEILIILSSFVVILISFIFMHLFIRLKKVL